MKMEDFAKELSHKLHAGQFRNDRKTPYTIHTDYVGDNVHKFYNDLSLDIARAVGFGHDILEDCNISFDELVNIGHKEYGSDWVWVCDNIYVLSRFNKESPILDYLIRIKACDITKAVKLADLEHNLSDLGPGNLRDKYHLCKNFLEN